MLSDNGSPYIARDTRIFASQLGLRPCFTPVKSPQSNGVSEAFVNTLSGTTFVSRRCRTPELSSTWSAGGSRIITKTTRTQG